MSKESEESGLAEYPTPREKAERDDWIVEWDGVQFAPARIDTSDDDMVLHVDPEAIPDRIDAPSVVWTEQERFLAHLTGVDVEDGDLRLRLTPDDDPDPNGVMFPEWEGTRTTGADGAEKTIDIYEAGEIPAGLNAVGEDDWLFLVYTRGAANVSRTDEVDSERRGIHLNGPEIAEPFGDGDGYLCSRTANDPGSHDLTVREDDEGVVLEIHGPAVVDDRGRRRKGRPEDRAGHPPDAQPPGTGAVGQQRPERTSEQSPARVCQRFCV